MLGTRERTLLLDSLRPPAGYRLRRAVGTSFTLDLMALLTAPLAFTFFDAHDDEGAPVADPVALLEALRRHAEKITLFCQAGAVAVPVPDQKLLAFIEGSVIEVQPPRKGGIFHPKVWVLNFESKAASIYRVLCLSRNLTFGRAWDTCLRIEGALTEGQGEFARNEPFAELLLELPGLSNRAIRADLHEDLSRMAEEIRRVDFRTPHPFTDFRVHTFGLGDRRGWPFPRGGRSLLVSPFLVGSAVRDLVHRHGLEVVISRSEAFEDVVRRVGRKALPETCYVLSPEADLDSRHAGQDCKEGANGPPVEDEIELAGLHAKLFLFENGRQSRLFTGSANATGAAFQHNVEVLVELVGTTKDCGIAPFLGSEADPTLETLRSLLQEYQPPDSLPPVGETQRVIEALERRAEQLTRILAAARLTATVRDADTNRSWDMTLSGELPQIPAGGKVRVWPATLSAEAALQLDGLDAPRNQLVGSVDATDAIATFSGLSFKALTAFFAFEITLREGQHKVRKRFAVTSQLVGTPMDRKPRLLRSLLKDRRRVLQLLFLILMGEGADVSAFVQRPAGDGSVSVETLGGWDHSTLLEALLQSLSRDPRRIDDAARLIADLQKTADGKDLLPEGLHKIWEPVWAAREALKS